MADEPAGQEAAPQEQSTQSMPTHVKVVSVLYYIGAAFTALAALMMFIGGGAMASLLGALGALGGALFGVLGVVLLGFAVLEFFVARGLWNGKNWARIVAIVLAAFGALTGLSSLLSGGIVWVAIDVYIIWALAFNKECKAAFG